MKFVAVTACPTGIAHSQMAAENIERVAEANGHEIDVEIQGAMGRENELSTAAIDAADAVIVAADTSVRTDRFGDKPLVKRPVADAVTDAEGLVEAAVRAAEGEAATSETDGSASESVGSDAGTDRPNGPDDRTTRVAATGRRDCLPGSSACSRERLAVVDGPAPALRVAVRIE